LPLLSASNNQKKINQSINQSIMVSSSLISNHASLVSRVHSLASGINLERRFGGIFEESADNARTAVGSSILAEAVSDGAAVTDLE
jgi:hypothetical protein